MYYKQPIKFLFQMVTWHFCYYAQVIAIKTDESVTLDHKYMGNMGNMQHERYG